MMRLGPPAVRSPASAATPATTPVAADVRRRSQTVLRKIRSAPTFATSLAFLLTLTSLCGCALTKYHVPPPTGDPLVDGQNAIDFGPPKDRVLWDYRTGLAAMHFFKSGAAVPYFEDALTRVEGVFQYDRSARQSRRMFSEEAKKTFIGEPYERVMAYYYRGILYWMNGEPDNARACFRSGQVHDSDTGEHQYASDYVLLDYLDGLATAKLGGDGSDAFKRAKEHARGPSPPPLDPAANLLVFVDFGPGPRKYATGEYGEELRFQERPTDLRGARITINGRTTVMPIYDDLYFQATTRGGRVMDHILGNKAVFKTATSVAGDAAIISGAILAAGDHNTEVGLGLIAAGALAKIISASTRPNADTRMWDNLPRYLTFASLRVPAGEYQATVEFLGVGNVIYGNLTKRLTVRIPESAADRVIYVSDQSIIHNAL